MTPHTRASLFRFRSILLFAAILCVLTASGAAAWMPEAAPAVARTVQYTYDAAGRLTTADYGEHVITYTYDNAGNPTHQEVGSGEQKLFLPMIQRLSLGWGGSVALAGLLLLLVAAAPRLERSGTQLRRAARRLARWARQLLHLTLLLALLLPAAMPTPARAQPPAPVTGAGPQTPLTPGIGLTRDWSYAVEVGDPIGAGSGAYRFTKPLMSLNTLIPLDLTLIYDINMGYVSNIWLPYRFYWSPYSVGKYDQNVNGKTFTTFQMPDGNWISFKRSGADWALADPTEDVGIAVYRDNGSSVRYTLHETTRYFFLMDPVAERVYLYEKVAGNRARLIRISDRNGNSLTYSYDPDYEAIDPTLLVRVDDGLGSYLRMNYTHVAGQIMLWQVWLREFDAAVVFRYDAAAADNGGALVLRSVEDTPFNTTTFAYSTANCPGGCVVQQTMALGNTPYTQTYSTVNLAGEADVRVTSQTDAHGNVTALAYSTTGNVVTATTADGATSHYEHFSAHSRPKALTDPQGSVIQLTKNEYEQITSVTDRLGGATTMTYHAPTGKLASLTNAAGGAIAFTYSPREQSFASPDATETTAFTFYDLIRVDYPATATYSAAAPDAVFEQFAYDDRGNVLTHTDTAGQLWTYICNARGQILTAANPTGGVATFTYDDATGTLATSTNSDAGAGVTTYTYYQGTKSLASITYPDGARVTLARDGNDRITVRRLVGAPGDTFLSRATYYDYDTNGNSTQVTDFAGATVMTYDAMDRIAQVRGGTGTTTTLAYDAVGRLATVSDPTGVVTTYGYDVRGGAAGSTHPWRNQVTRGGTTWRMSYDAEGLVAAATTPLGRTTTFARDALGNVTGVTDALGDTTTLTYDALNRLTTVTDPLNRTTAYGYDAHDLLTSVTAPGVGAATYDRDAAGNLTAIHDLNGNVWSFGYSANGRLIAQTDPLARTTTQSYDARGRLTVTTYPDAATLTRSYDAASNLIGLHSASSQATLRATTAVSLGFTYDRADRLTQTDGLLLAYDAENRVIGTSEGYATDYDATYDAAGRLKTVDYALSDLVATYTYSPTTGLLMRVSDSHGNAVDFSYDGDFRLAGLARSNGVTAALTWDAADRLTRIQDGSITDLRYTLDAAGQVTALHMNAPLDPATHLQGAANTLTFDAAGQISSAGYSYDACGRQTAAPGATYTWDDASRLAAINTTTLTYNGLGDVRTRSADGVTTHYYYNHALGMAPIVAEGQETASAARQTTPDTIFPARYYVYTPDGALLYSVDRDGRPTFYHFDRTGSTLALTDGSGAVTDAYAYDPYGKLLAHTGTSTQPFTFVGQWGVRHEAGTLYQMRARYYDAGTQRFLSREPSGQRIYDPLQINPYQYAKGDPVKYIDNSGNVPIDPDFLPQWTPEQQDQFTNELGALNDWLGERGSVGFKVQVDKKGRSSPYFDHSAGLMDAPETGIQFGFFVMKWACKFWGQRCDEEILKGLAVMEWLILHAGRRQALAILGKQEGIEKQLLQMQKQLRQRWQARVEAVNPEYQRERIEAANQRDQAMRSADAIVDQFSGFMLSPEEALSRMKGLLNR